MPDTWTFQFPNDSFAAKPVLRLTRPTGKKEYLILFKFDGDVNVSTKPSALYWSDSLGLPFRYLPESQPGLLALPTFTSPANATRVEMTCRSWGKRSIDESIIDEIILETTIAGRTSVILSEGTTR